MKVVHVLGQLNIGGIECWLRDILSESTKNPSFTYSIIIEKEEFGELEQDFLNLGIDIIRVCPSKKSKLKYLAELFKIFKEKKFDIVHSHVSFISGYVNLIAYLANIKNRITHIHSDRRRDFSNNGLIKKIEMMLSIICIEIFSTNKIAVSLDASKMLLSIKPTKIIPCGKLFIREEFELDYKERFLNIVGWGKNDIILCSIGRLEKVKNHSYIINFLDKLTDNYKYLIIGEGAERENLEKLVDKLNLNHRVKLLGSTHEVSKIMSNISTVFLFPSLHEGLGLAAIEAQYYGIPVIMSENVPKEIIINENVFSIKLDNMTEWLEKIQTFRSSNKIKPNYNLIEERFSIKSNIKILNKIYSGR